MSSIFKTYDAETKTYVQVWPGESELLPGQTVIELFWCASANTYVTVPGASEYRVNEDLDLVLVRD